MFERLRKALPSLRKQAPLPAAPPTRAPSPEIGVSGLRHFAGEIYEEAHRELRSTQKKWQKFQEMRENDAVVGSVMFAVEMLMRRVEWNVQPASEESADVEAAEFLDSCVEDMSHTFTAFISEVLWMLTYGFMPFELVYKLRVGPNERDGRRRSKFTDRKIGWRKFAPRGPETVERWLFDDDGGVNGFAQRDPNSNDVYPIPIQQLLLFNTTSHKNNPEGRSLLRSAFVAWKYKKHIEEIESIGIERDMVGYPVLRLPPSVFNDTATLTSWKNVIRDVRRDEQEGITLPSEFDPETKEQLYKFELIASPGSKQFDTNKVIDRHNSAIAAVVLMDWILMGHQQVGTQALASEKVPVAEKALNGWMQSIADVLNRHAIPRLFQVNRWNLQEHPKLVTGDVRSPELDKLSNLLRNLTQAGAAILPDDNIENWVLRAAGLPEKTEPETE